jgi:hypothetical protein
MKKIEIELNSPLKKKMNEIYALNFLYIPSIKPIPGTVHEKLLIGGKAYIEEIWSDIWTQKISMKFKDIPTLIFEFHTIENLQEKLKEEYGNKEAYYKN